MIFELIKAILIAGLPVALISYYLIMLTRKKTQLKSTNAKQLKKELQTIDVQHDSQEPLWQSMLQKKFIKFGGGFYGILTLITYLHIEIYQLIQFVGNFSGFEGMFESGILRFIIGLIIEAVMNLVTAFMWPIYWPNFLPIGSLWVWLIVSILAHTVATKYALSKNINHSR